MKTNLIEVIYRYGKFYNAQTGQRIIIAPESRFQLMADDSCFLKEDPQNTMTSNYDSESMANMVSKKFPTNKLLYPKGTLLHFSIRTRRGEKKGFKGVDNIFDLELLEDLYLVKNEAKSGSVELFRCKCVVMKYFGTPIPGFEPVYAYSLNNAYMKTYDFFFALNGAPTVNVYNRFYTKTKEGRIVRLQQVRSL